MIDRAKALEKVRKCLRLGASANEHEAAAAMRHAQKLMTEHGITEADVDAADAGESRSRTNAKGRPVDWETGLANLVGEAFGCETIFSPGSAYWERPGEWIFVGVGSAPEIASFPFTVLARQLRKARKEHIAHRLNRCGPSSKTRRADVFCMGWVTAVQSKLQKFAGTERQVAAIIAYIDKQLGGTVAGKALSRMAGRALSARDHCDWVAGSRSGAVAELRHGVARRAQDAIEASR